MPSFGISDADCEGDENFAGHEDLLFKRTLFQTVHPLEKVRSVAAHTLLSRKLRESSAVSRVKESRYVNPREDIWTPSPSLQVRQPRMDGILEAAENIADYYIQKVSLRMQQKCASELEGNAGEDDETVIESGRSKKQLSVYGNVEKASDPTLVSVPAIATQLLLPTAKDSNEGSVSTLRSVQDGGQKPSAQVSSYSNTSLLTSSTGSEKSFDFLGTPATSLPSTETMSKMAYLDTYNGSRPSFGLGTLTSTPFTFPKKIAVVELTSNVKLNLENYVAESAKSSEDVSVATGGSALKLKNASDPTPKQLSSLEGFYVKEMEIAEDYDKAKKHVEEDKNQKALRALTKRTIVEKVTVESKKTASLQEISSVSSFLCKLLNGMVVTGYGGKSLQLPDGDFRCYGFVITIESYMGVVERDPLLVLVISRILILLCANVPKFESVLMGKLLRTSQLLTLNQEKCAAYAEHLSLIEDRRFALIPETSIIKLFVHLHVTGSACKGMAHFTSEALWRVVSFLTEESCRTIATAAMLLEIVENGSIPLEKADSRKWSAVLKKISSSLVPKLQDQVDEDDLRRSTGEDSLVASLRHAVSRRSSG